MVSILVNILLFILVIGFLTFVHELGHFLAAKSIKTKVFEFSLGFGPKLFSKRFKGTLYCIRAIPLGGFVKILGDGDPSDYEGEKNVKKSKYNLSNKPKILQIFVMLAGVTMNIFLAIFLYYIILGVSGWKTSPIYFDFEGVNIVGAKVDKVVGYEVIEGGVADLAGLPEYGLITGIDGVDILDKDEISENFKDKEQVSILVCDDKQIDCNEYAVELDEEGKIGVLVSHGYILNYTDVKPFAGVVYLVNNLKLISHILDSMILSAKESGDYTDLSNTVSGPVGIFLLIDNLKTEGIVVFLSLIADLSLSLAIMNILPIPALDGGRVGILLVEGILRRDLNEKIKTTIINGSMAFLLLLIVLVIIKDVVNIDNMREMFS